MGKPHEDEDDGDETVEVTDGGADEQEEEDRGDVVNPEETPDNLKDLADEGEDGEEDDAGGGKAPKLIPKGRFDEVNEKRISAETEARLLREENARLRGEKGTKKDDDKPAFDIEAKEGEYADALMEGDKAKATAIRKEINAHLRAEAEESASAKAEQRILERQAKQEFTSAVAAVIEDYPFLDSKSAKANRAAIGEVVEWRDFYMSKGHSAADALVKAAQKVGPQYQKAPKGKQDDDDEDGEPQGKPKSKIDELRAARLRKAASAANNQPARLDGGMGNRGTGGKVNVEEMDDETFNSLSEKEKARLRGDIA